MLYPSPPPTSPATRGKSQVGGGGDLDVSGSNRKFGRNKNRPSGKRYTAESRWVKNAAKRVARHAKRMQKKAAHRQKWEARAAARRIRVGGFQSGAQT